ncbi:hypothetical protein HYFRA_00010377 [Hymenoscyphus fraxineus]|uniref:Anthranilate phosphoribosyltransferase n=1 Tax=Hymenoscyphus fraxineus TaxID=746836 RepID=A0A9N9L2Q1_9HELO|nr:hypothetical protein HYFRA_00010377 [Hymenoscyphus fraxineus]
MAKPEEDYVAITSLLKYLAEGDLPINETIDAVALLYQGKLSPVQAASLLTLLNTTGLDQDPNVIAQCAANMRKTGLQIDYKRIMARMNTQKSEKIGGSYLGGYCTIEGTGGDGHSTFNVSTAASIVASAVVFVAKHGAGASSSKSGAADVLRATTYPSLILEAVTPDSISTFFENGSFTFLFAPIFHPGLKQVTLIRKQLGFKTIFNILGPLTHPLNSILEARVVGVAQRRLGPIYAEALRISGVQNALVVCGAEELDEISCAGPTFCWRLSPGNDDDVVRIDCFQLEPADFGLPTHDLDQVPMGKSPDENAEILMQLLSNQLPTDSPTLHFVLMNAAALLVVSGICDGETGGIVKEIGPGGGRWKEGVRRARKGLEDGKSLESFDQFINGVRRDAM